jgi:hypothetical protein
MLDSSTVLLLVEIHDLPLVALDRVRAVFAIPELIYGLILVIKKLVLSHV